MNFSDIANSRLYNHRLSSLTFTKVEDVVKWLGAVQSQDYVGGLLTIGMRMKSVTEKIVEQAVMDRKIVRTWPMRGTLHFVSAEDVHWMTNLLAPRVMKKYTGMYNKIGLDKDTISKARKVVVKSLEKEKFLTRDEIYEKLKASGIGTTNMRGINIIGILAMESLICFGPRQGKQHTFTLLEEYIPKRLLSNDEALGTLALRYFSSHGPAQLKDFMWWAGLLQTEAKKSIELIKSKLIEEEVDGKIYYSTESVYPTKVKSKAYLLQAYDEFTVAYKDRDAIFDNTNAEKVKNGMGFTSVLVINGQVEGFWKRTIKKDEVMIELDNFHKLNRDEKELIDEAAKGYGRFIGKTYVL